MSQWGQPGRRPQQGYPQPGWGAPRPGQQWGQPSSGQPGWGQPRPPQNWGQPNSNWGQPSGFSTPPTNQWNPNRVQQPTWGHPTPRRNPAALVLKLVLGVFALAVLGFIGLVGLGTYLVGSDYGTGGSGSSAPQTESGGSRSRTAPTTEYQNEDYQVPPADLNPPELPSPETYEEATQWMVDNPIYSSTLQQPVECEATPIDLQAASTEQLQAHMNDFTACLMRVFGPAIEDAGFVPVRPSVTIYTSEINTKCGTVPMNNAVYCGSDQQVYYAIDLPEIIPYRLRDLEYVVESVIAHEFGHAIQGRTGILISEMAWEQESTEADANNLSRRLEVQADCFAGQFISSVAQSVEIDNDGVDDLSKLFYAIGDDQLSGDPGIDGNHGRGKSRQAWYRSGTSSASMGACNSFAADDAEVR